MLHLIPAPLHRALYRVADKARRLWWRVYRKPRGRSAVVLAFDATGRVLLVRHSYGPPVWTVPGGGVRRGEEPAAAAAREVREELGCDLAGLTALETGAFAESNSPAVQHAFTARLAGEPVADQREIVELSWFHPADLPANTARAARRLIARAWRSAL